MTANVKGKRLNQRELRAQLIEKFPREQTYLLPALHYIHHELGHLPEWALQVAGWHLHVPASEVYGSATSYTELRIEPTGEHLVRVCTGVSCSLNGAAEVLAAFQAGLGIEPGQTTDDGRVTLEETACAFQCGVPPAVEVDGRFLGRMDAGRVPGVVESVQGRP